MIPDHRQLGELTFAHLAAVVAVDSQSDELSTTLPTTQGQVVLAGHLADFYRGLGAEVEQDAHANVIARFPGRGRGADKAPVAFMVHLDTARGTIADQRLHRLPRWDGSRVPFPKNPGIRVDVANYPGLSAFVGQELVFGEGQYPFGLDDKLGLAECMTLARVLAEAPELDRPPLLFVSRPDEEVGRHEAVVGLADLFAKMGVRWAFTADGILPYEVNLENFNAAMASVSFPTAPPRPLRGSTCVAHIGGVNTHGATAAAEGHRAAPRLAAEWLAALDPADAVILSFRSDDLRDCDAVVGLRVAEGALGRVRAALESVMAPHLDRGASWSLEAGEAPFEDGAAEAALAWIGRFLASQPGFTLPAEESEGRDGYSHPMRVRRVDGGLRVDVRLRDFEEPGLARRVAHVKEMAGDLHFAVVDQYVNMGPRLAAHPGLAQAAERAARAAGVPLLYQPIRGGTGVDPFLVHDIPVANLGTGYFAPESEKELTTVELMAGHARWLLALVADLAENAPRA